MKECYERQIEFKTQRGVWNLEFNYFEFILLLLYKYKVFAKGCLVISMKEIYIFSRADKFLLIINKITENNEGAGNFRNH